MSGPDAAIRVERLGKRYRIGRARGYRSLREEIVEATFVASAIRAGAATTHGTMALKFFDQSADGPAKA